MASNRVVVVFHSMALFRFAGEDSGRRTKEVDMGENAVPWLYTSAAKHVALPVQLYPSQQVFKIACPNPDARSRLREAIGRE